MPWKGEKGQAKNVIGIKGKATINGKMRCVKNGRINIRFPIKMCKVLREVLVDHLKIFGILSEIRIHEKIDLIRYFMKNHFYDASTLTFLRIFKVCLRMIFSITKHFNI